MPLLVCIYQFAFCTGQTHELTFTFTRSPNVLTIRKPGVNILQTWSISLHWDQLCPVNFASWHVLFVHTACTCWLMTAHTCTHTHTTPQTHTRTPHTCTHTDTHTYTTHAHTHTHTHREQKKQAVVNVNCDRMVQWLTACYMLSLTATADCHKHVYTADTQREHKTRNSQCELDVIGMKVFVRLALCSVRWKHVWERGYRITGLVLRLHGRCLGWMLIEEQLALC